MLHTLYQGGTAWAQCAVKNFCNAQLFSFFQDVTIEDMGPYPFIVSVTSEDGHLETKRTELGRGADVE